MVFRREFLGSLLQKAAVLVLLPLMIGCGQSDGTFREPYKATNFCKEENRQLSDTELKARILLSMTEDIRGKNKIPDDIQAYISKHLLPDSGRESKLKILEQYVTLYPGCCWFNSEELKDRRNPLYRGYLDLEPPYISDADFDVVGYFVSRGYIANFYVYEHQRNYQSAASLNGVQPVRRRGGWRSVGASNCGNIFIIS